MFKLLMRITKPKLNQRSISKLPEHPELDIDYYCNPSNLQKITSNINNRKGIGNIELVQQLKHKLDGAPEQNDLKVQLLDELLKIPNKTHEAVPQDTPLIIRTFGKPRSFDFNPREFYEITKRLNLVRTDHLGSVAGSRSYYVQGELAELEQALIKFTLKDLMRRGFKLMSVPDILDRALIEGCGMATKGQRTQVYSLEPKLHGDNLCLSGTSEMALAGYFASKTIPESELPIKLATVSRCYRAETSSIAEERGIFRVHQFTKVEMFAITTPDKSDKLLDEILSIQEANFSSLGLHLRSLDMPAFELGAPAFRKYDVEAWLPGRKTFGEISSCSNCTDYQSRRLGIKYGSGDHVHTLNGTACAIPRMLIAIVESYQNDNGTVDVPEVLREFMGGKTKFSRQKRIPELKLVKNKNKKKD